jgi:hypothetical protein
MLQDIEDMAIIVTSLTIVTLYQKIVNGLVLCIMAISRAIIRKNVPSVDNYHYNIQRVMKQNL